MERTPGTQVIGGFEELQSVINAYHRTWIVAAPFGLFSFLFGPDITHYINKYGKVVYESYDARIYLLQS